MSLYTEEEWEEISQDLPKESDPFMQKYIQGREALIAQENKERSGKYLLTTPNRLLLNTPPPFSLADARENLRCIV